MAGSVTGKVAEESIGDASSSRACGHTNVAGATGPLRPSGPERLGASPASLTTPLRHDLTTVPLTDIPPSVLVLAWPTHSTSPSVAALARAASKAAADITASSANTATSPATVDPR